MVSTFYFYFLLLFLTPDNLSPVTYHPPPAIRHPLPVTRYPSPGHPSPATRHPSPAEKSCRDQNGQSVYPFSDQNDAKTQPDGVAETYIAYIKKYPSPGLLSFFILKMSTITREYSQLIVTSRWVKKVQLYIKLLCWLVSLRDRGFNHSTQSCSTCVLRGVILVSLVCSKTRKTHTDYLTFADKKCYTSHSGWKF